MKKVFNCKAFGEYCQIALWKFYTNLHSQKQAISDPFSYTMTWLLIFFNIFANLISEKWFHYCINLYFLVSNETEQLLHILDHLYFLFCELSVHTWYLTFY